MGKIPRSMNVRLIVELVAHHGNLSVPDLRSLSLAHKPSSPTVQNQISKQKKTHVEEGRCCYTFYILPELGCSPVAHGFCFWYGELSKKRRYQDGLKQGIELDCIQEGTRRTTNWVDGHKHGISERVRDPKGVDWLAHFENGRNHGLFRCWHDGTVSYQRTAIDGNYNGMATQWYENSMVAFKMMYKNEKRHGTFTKWYESGQLKERIEYYENKRVGINTEWHKNGQLASRRQYYEGQLDGEYVECYEDGQIRECGFYIKDELQYVTAYDPVGQN